MLSLAPLPFSLPSFLSPGLLAAGALTLLLVPWLLVKPRLALTFLLFSLAVGQSLRLPFPGQAGGLLLSDIAAALILFSAFFQALRTNTSKKNHNLQITNSKQSTKHEFSKAQTHQANSLWFVVSVVCVFTPFILWSLFSLAINAANLELNQFFISFSYWLRLTSNLLLIPALLFLLQDDQLRSFTLKALLITTLSLAILGFAQLFVVPNLSVLPGQWDPHPGRLVSTWLDPNFFGAFLAMVLPLAIGYASLGFRLWKLFGICVLLIVSLVLTQSRSAILALLLATLVLSPLIIAIASRHSSQAKRIFFTGGLAFILLAVAGSGVLLHQRFLGLVNLDATVNLRLTSLQAVWPLAAENSLLGVGYNAYQFAALNSGLISDFTLHSRAGSDNSYLNLLITTGLPGLVLFLLPLFYLSHELLRRSLAKNYFALGALVAFITLLIHANFVNSLLYSHLLITLAVILALALPRVRRVGDKGSQKQ